MTEEEWEQCPSLRFTILHKEGTHPVYLRCKTRAGHEGKHRSWLKQWQTEEQDGVIHDA